MRTLIRFVAFLAFAGWLALMCGCAPSHNSLTAPTITANSSVPQGRVLLGVYNLNFGPDGEYSITEIRSGESHVNVTKSLFPPKCLDCFLAELVDKVGELWQFKFTIKNPFNLTGYDCRVTLVKQGDISVLNPSSYTKVFALPTDPDPINPFLIFDSGNSQNEWGPGAQATSYLTLQKPTGSKFNQVTFAVDGSFPSNQEDPYILTNITAKPPSVDVDGSDAINIAVTVLDWQNNVNTVTVDLSPLGGSGTEALTNIFGNMWIIEDVHYKSGGQGVGTYNLLLTASSVGNETYSYAKVGVTEAGASDFWVEINQEAGTADTGQDVEFTAIPHNGTGPYNYDWDMNYDFITFTPDINGETVKWNWSEVGTYNIRLKAESYDGQTAIADTTIVVGQVSPSITVVSPNGGEDWSVGSAQDISWTWSGSIPTVDIYLSTDGGATYPTNLAGSVSNTGSWQLEPVPDQPATQAKIKVEMTDNTSVFDESDACFSIISVEDSGWAKTWGGSSEDSGYGVAMDSSGNTYVTGCFFSIVDFDPGSGLDDHTGPGVFLSKFDSLGNFIWAKTWGGSEGDLGNGVAVDNAENVYVTGTFNGTVDFKPGSGMDNHTANGSYDVFLSKFDSSGNFIWAKTWGGSSYDGGFSVAADTSGNVFVTGFFNGTVDFDLGSDVDNHTSNGSDDAFLSKFDSSGNFLWAKTWGGIDNNDVGVAVAVDISGNALVTGRFQSGFDFNPGSGVDNHASSGIYDVFLSKFDSSGNFIWAKTWGGSEGDLGNGVAVDNAENVYVTGGFWSSSVDFDPGSGVDNHNTNGWADAFLSKFDSSGNFIWAKTWGGSDNNEIGNAVTVDSSGIAFVTGCFNGTVDFDPGSGVDNHTADGPDDTFLSKFDTLGNFIWAKTWGGGTDYENGYGVAVDGSGSVYVTGFFDDTVDFDPGSGVDNHTSNDADDVFLSKFLPDGSW